ncbi:DegV family uncharacterized protein [Muricomes intestini]|uniref:DegV family uncharacterized protein n=1 Tax=Muricomes intestini TaxID=1796634 RepID=A0A4R3K046_9FIRM|nr:DegV family uncharacterized protein [Muricomes intestini]
MDSDYVISCCSTADLTAGHFEKNSIAYICFHYELDGKEYTDDLGQSVSFSEFYEALKNGAETKTSQVNAEEFEYYFEGFLKEGKDILHVCLSSGLSGVIKCYCRLYGTACRGRTRVCREMLYIAGRLL